MVTLVVFDEVLLAIKNVTTPDHDTRPIFASLMHPHFVLFPVGLGLEGLQSLLFGAVRAEHVRFAGLAQASLVWKQNGRRDADVVCGSDAVLELIVVWAADV